MPTAVVTGPVPAAPVAAAPAVASVAMTKKELRTRFRAADGSSAAVVLRAQKGGKFLTFVEVRLKGAKTLRGSFVTHDSAGAAGEEQERQAKKLAAKGWRERAPKKELVSDFDEIPEAPAKPVASGGNGKQPDAPKGKK